MLSGINHGVTVGRSALHSGTVGAALTASQLGISALAVSLRAGADPDPWDSAADLAVALVPLLVAAPVRTVLNLNVPHVPLHEIRGLRWARVGGAGLIKAARGGSPTWEAPNPEESGRGTRRRRGGSRRDGGRARGSGARSCSPWAHRSPRRATSRTATPAPRTPRWLPAATPR